MNKKTFLQLLILTLIIGIVFISYKKFDSNQSTTALYGSPNSKSEIDKEKKISNLIYNIKYTVDAKDGSDYNIESKEGELNVENPNLINMKYVTAFINMPDSSIIKITSDYALYDSIKFNTQFYDNILISYGEHEITSNNLDFIPDKNLATIYNNVIFNNVNTNMRADKIELDLITKDSKIFMYDKSKNIEIINKK